MCSSSAPRGALTALLRHFTSPGTAWQQLFEIFTYPTPHCFIVTELTPNQYNMINATQGKLEQLMKCIKLTQQTNKRNNKTYTPQLKFSENETIYIWAEKPFTNVYRLTCSNTTVCVQSKSKAKTKQEQNTHLTSFVRQPWRWSQHLNKERRVVEGWS